MGERPRANYGWVLYPAIMMAFFWAIGIGNSCSVGDSMGGLALGLAAIASAFFVLVTIDAQQPHSMQRSSS